MLKKRWFRLLLIPAVLYLFFCAGMVFVKEELIFPFRGVERAQSLKPPRGAAVWWSDVEPGQRIEAWFFVGKGRSAAAPGPAVVYFHGNGELIDDNVDRAHAFTELGISVLLVEYRGYGRSGGATKIGNIRGDAGVWFDRLAAQPEVRSNEVMTYGFSLGSAFAAQLARLRPVAALLLESPFTGLPAMARERGIWLYFSTERLATNAVLKELPAAMPVLITHQKNDSVIRVTEGRKLAALRPSAVYIEGADGHEPFAVTEPGRGSLRQFLTKWIPAD